MLPDELDWCSYLALKSHCDIFNFMNIFVILASKGYEKYCQIGIQ